MSAPVPAAASGPLVRREQRHVGVTPQAATSEAPATETTWLAWSKGPSFTDRVPAPVHPIKSLVLTFADRLFDAS